jgi:Raf kinase inhibitor-like YbhB/YbcL family protein
MIGRKILVVLVLILITAGLLAVVRFGFERSFEEEVFQRLSVGRRVAFVAMNKFTLLSSAFDHNREIPAQYTCDGENVSPPLAFSGMSKETQSFVLVMDDPDAVGGTWDHWVVWNISPLVTEIAEGSVPSGAVEGTTSFGAQQYGGPCPPKGTGTHRYTFTLYALDGPLELPPSTTKAGVLEAVKERVLNQAVLVGLYQRG